MAHNGLNEASVHITHRIELTRPRALPAALGTKPVKLVKSVGKFFTGNRSDGLFKTIEIMVGGESNNETGWRLVFTALERAIDQLFERADSNRNELDMAIEQAFDRAQQRCGETIDLDRIRIEPNFLDQPKSLALLKPAKTLLAELLQIYQMDGAQAASIADRLPTYFANALEFANAQHAGAAKAIFDLTKSPAAQAAIKENLWVKAHHELGERLNEGVLGDEFSLRQLYQPLRAYRAVKHDEGEVRRTVFDLETELDRWVAAADRKDAIRVICGGPGSGKSSFAKIWASRFDPLATRKTLLVPLHQPKGDNLDVSIEWYCRQICGFAHSAVDVDAGEPELLLLLDGLDELSMAGKTGLAAAHDLIDQVGRLIEARNTKSARLLVLIGGREILVQSLENRLRKVPIFHLMPYFHKDPAKQNRFEFPDGFLARDQRHDWWQRWGQLTDDPTISEFPKDLVKNDQIADLARQPLLNHLLARAKRRGKLAIDETTNINEIYADILNDVWLRSWGDPTATGNQQTEPFKEFTEEDFTRIFEEIGLVAWQHGNTRTVEPEAIENAIAQDPGLSQKFQRFQTEGQNQKALSLLTSFFFRRNSGETGSGTFELAHKSFAEYFAARRLVRLIRELRPLIRMPQSQLLKAAIERWFELTNANKITFEIKDFLKNELDMQAEEGIDDWRDDLIALFNHNLKVGMPFAGIANPPAELRELEKRTAAAELALLAGISACTDVIITLCDGDFSATNIERIRWHPE